MVPRDRKGPTKEEEPLLLARRWQKNEKGGGPVTNTEHRERRGREDNGVLGTEKKKTKPKLYHRGPRGQGVAHRNRTVV